MKTESMSRRFLFRLDGSKDNDYFFTCRRGQGNCVAYSGTTMTVGPGWISDLIEVDFAHDGSTCGITLVELEASEVTARMSCRKYLPESSDDIVRGLGSYLDSVIAQCCATSDPRVDDLRSLREALSGQVAFGVRTAGALRSSEDFLEVHTLLDQPERVSLCTIQPAVVAPTFAFTGTMPLSREVTDGLRRTARIFHAVVMGHDHSGGTLHSWRNIRRKPLDIAVAKEPERLGQLNQLLVSRAIGMRIDCEQLVEELAGLWAASSDYRLTIAEVTDCVKRFAPVAMRFPNSESMRNVFDAARLTLETFAIKQNH